MHVLKNNGSILFDSSLPNQINEKWLIISNCQTVGLAHSISLLADNVEAVACDIWAFMRDFNDIKDKIHEYAHIITSLEVKRLGLIDFDQYSNVTVLPNMFFRGYHPDLCHVYHTGGPVIGPADAYQSLIVAVSHKLGLSPDRVFPLFSNDVYRRLGFYDIWNTEKLNLIESFDQLGWDVRESLVKWIRHGSFMHSVNHPKIEVLFDIAKLVVGKIRGIVNESDLRPHDNIIHGPAFPIYPEIAEYYGIQGGSYLFKPLGHYRLFSLKEFVEKSFLAFEQYPRESLQIDSPHLDKAINLIQELT